MDNREDPTQPDIERREGTDENRPTYAGADETSTTHNITHEADQALKRYNAELDDGRESALIEGNEVKIRIEVRGAETPMMLVVRDDIVIGRRDPTTNIVPDLDLTPYGGYQMGISRRHAVLSLQDHRLTITDVGSRNGTYLNGYRLEANQAVRLHDEDEIRLGKIIFRLFVQNQ